MEKRKEISIQVAEVLLIICLNMTKVVGSLFKKAIGFTYQRVVRILITQTKPKKVANMVGTFLTEDSDSRQVSTTQTRPKKVTNTVGTFLKDDSNSRQGSAVKTKPKKVTNMVGTFLSEDSDSRQVPTTQPKPKKVANMVGTFLNKVSDGLWISKVTTNSYP